ncbi:hypothetical protein A5745_21560 [Mycobacterium sp. IS-2888]|uniref:hypothetical protein n=1 Tax=unclassified Mycobacterium TaxID=2642494 RepID=UPI00096E1C69|nr:MULTISPECIES: hypothetical protein [unclassified Mycobacterium]OMC42538.1 hypothetical protein A5744_16745 [Mycobacterium sp. IS-1264]OMC53394.1 hypothetical protein A5745_21560 [Mycobacterium sp. IS-2888]
MSYDLTVYAASRIDDEELEAVIESVPGLAAGDSGDHELTVLRGKQEKYAFTIFGPYEIEPEDVPDDVVPYVLEPTTSWQVVVEGSDPAEVRPARRFAKALAVAAGGVAFDEQTEDILGARAARKATRPAAELIRILDLHWYSPASAPNAPTLWLELARKLLPEALPRRFGEYYPYQHKLDRDGDEAFISSYGRSKGGFYSPSFTATLPVLDGGLYAPDWGGILIDSIRMVAEPLDDPRWRNTVRRFFVEYARRRGCVLATGEVLRNHKLAGPPDHSWDLSGLLRDDDGILGLPANPIWWTWLGTDYLPLVREYLPPEHTTYYAEGALYAPTDEPTDRGQLAALPDPFPNSLRVTAIPSDYGPANPPKNSPAAIRPTSKC